jgi:YggT family protein
MISILQILYLVLNILKYIIIAQIVLSWLINFNILNVHQPFVMQVWNGLNQFLDPIYSRLRRFLPYSGSIDFAPLAVFVLILAAQIIISNNIGKFY